jgi:hypothetical protein
MARIYVASSWRNTLQPEVVQVLRAAGHQVYDFKNPPDRAGFGWESVVHPGQDFSSPVGAEALIDALRRPLAKAGFKSDHDAMEWADTFVMVLPCGMSAHLELGWACGKGKRTVVLMAEPDTPELMYLEADFIARNANVLLSALETWSDSGEQA